MCYYKAQWFSAAAALSLSLCGCLVCCFGLSGPLRRYFSLYRAVSQREEETREKMFKQPIPAPTASTVGPCPTLILVGWLFWV